MYFQAKSVCCFAAEWKVKSLLQPFFRYSAARRPGLRRAGDGFSVAA